VLENGHAIALEMLVEGYAVAGAAKEIGVRALALLERLLAEIEAVEFDQIEGTEHCCVVMVAITEEFENREPLPIDDNGLAINDA
jgi:hypothetical protein